MHHVSNFVLNEYQMKLYFTLFSHEVRELQFFPTFLRTLLRKRVYFIKTIIWHWMPSFGNIFAQAAQWNLALVVKLGCISFKGLNLFVSKLAFLFIVYFQKSHWVVHIAPTTAQTKRVTVLMKSLWWSSRTAYCSTSRPCLRSQSPNGPSSSMSGCASWIKYLWLHKK